MRLASIQRAGAPLFPCKEGETSVFSLPVRHRRLMMAAAFVSSGPSSLASFKKGTKGEASSLHHQHKSLLLAYNPSLSTLFLRKSLYGSRRRKEAFRKVRPVSPVMEWQDCSSVIEIDVPCSVAYECYSDRESIPQWMPFISSVKVLKDKPDLSRWTLKYDVFGRDVEFSWLARNMQPIPNQKIHWRALDGLPNRGAVRFYPKGPSSCRIELTVSYEVPQILIPVASALKPFVEGLLLSGLERFATVARDYRRKASKL